MFFRIPNPSYNPHGKKVVEHFSAGPGGILELEKRWRKNFLSNMEPKFLPKNWMLSGSIELQEDDDDEQGSDCSDEDTEDIVFSQDA